MKPIVVAENEITCPGCGVGQMVERKGKFGIFWGCDSFPKCRQILKDYQDGCFVVSKVVMRIDQIFSKEAGDGVNFATIHKAKGLEANRVFSFIKNCPHPLAKGNEAQEAQEINLEYIRDSRFIEEMYFVMSEEKW